MTPSNDTLVREFVEAFNTKDADRLAPYLHPDALGCRAGRWRRS
ncbi:nuclear transport factor 2 family protein [Micromonospora sp. C95]|nr:nuclear transport factor 2 family protein [Micromonospora sp. C95]